MSMRLQIGAIVVELLACGRRHCRRHHAPWSRAFSDEPARPLLEHAARRRVRARRAHKVRQSFPRPMFLHGTTKAGQSIEASRRASQHAKLQIYIKSIGVV